MASEVESDPSVISSNGSESEVKPSTPAGNRRGNKSFECGRKRVKSRLVAIRVGVLAFPKVKVPMRPKVRPIKITW